MMKNMWPLSLHVWLILVNVFLLDPIVASDKMSFFFFLWLNANSTQMCVYAVFVTHSLYWLIPYLGLYYSLHGSTIPWLIEIAIAPSTGCTDMCSPFSTMITRFVIFLCLIAILHRWGEISLWCWFAFLRSLVILSSILIYVLFAFIAILGNSPFKFFIHFSSALVVYIVYIVDKVFFFFLSSCYILDTNNL